MKLKTPELIGWIFAIILSVFLLLGSLNQWLPLGITEVLGFITGAACVWLTVKQNIWSWPIGIANNIFFIILFLGARLYADMALQGVYIFLGLWGWYMWLYGGKNRSHLKVSRTTPKMAIILIIISIISTYFMTLYLRTINDAAPFLDALTTVMSLIAQFMLTKKLLENWLVWISADIIYIYLYFDRGLPLTGILYFIFLLMCIAGLIQWKNSLNTTTEKLRKHNGVSVND